MTTTGLLLAAGQSKRFGAQNKLTAILNGQALVCYAADAMREAGFDALLAVVSDDAVATHLDGFRLCHLEGGEASQSRSLVAGVSAATGADRITIALGDMPRVTSELLRDVTRLCPAEGAAASTNGSRRMPPASFDAALFDRLKSLTGDRGAGALLRDIPDACILTPDPTLLVDVDTPADLAAPVG